MFFTEPNANSAHRDVFPAIAPQVDNTGNERGRTRAHYESFYGHIRTAYERQVADSCYPHLVTRFAKSLTTAGFPQTLLPPHLLASFLGAPVRDAGARDIPTNIGIAEWQKQNYHEPAPQARLPQKTYLLTFDDAPFLGGIDDKAMDGDEENTDGSVTMTTLERLLDGLKAKNVKAMFFLLGWQLQEFVLDKIKHFDRAGGGYSKTEKESLYPNAFDQKKETDRVERIKNIMSRLVDEGHVLGAHTWAHATVQRFANDMQFERDVERFEEAYFAIFGDRPWFFRAPHGVVNPYLLRYLSNRGYIYVDLGHNSHDYKAAWDPVKYSPNAIRRRISESVWDLSRRPADLPPHGRMILFHEKANTADTIPGLIEDAEKRGWKSVARGPLPDPVTGARYAKEGDKDYDNAELRTNWETTVKGLVADDEAWEIFHKKTCSFGDAMRYRRTRPWCSMVPERRALTLR